MQKNSDFSFISKIIGELAPEFGAQVVFGEDNVFGGYFLFPDGRKSFFKGSSWDINNLGVSKVANDKTMTLFFLDQAGYRVPNGKLLALPIPDFSFVQKEISSLKYPIIVKPNSLSRARGVVRVEKEDELPRAIKEAENFEKYARIEEEARGRHFCAGILDGKVFLVYEKKPFSGGEVLSDFSDKGSEEVKNWLGRAADTIGLSFAGVDFIYEKEGPLEDPNSCVIIEINASPSFKHYGSIGEEARENVKSLYRGLIRKLSK